VGKTSVKKIAPAVETESDRLETLSQELPSVRVEWGVVKRGKFSRTRVRLKESLERRHWGEKVVGGSLPT